MPGDPSGFGGARGAEARRRARRRLSSDLTKIGKVSAGLTAARTNYEESTNGGTRLVPAITQAVTQAVTRCSKSSATPAHAGSRNQLVPNSQQPRRNARARGQALFLSGRKSHPQAGPLIQKVCFGGLALNPKRARDNPPLAEKSQGSPARSPRRRSRIPISKIVKRFAVVCC